MKSNLLNYVHTEIQRINLMKALEELKKSLYKDKGLGLESALKTLVSARSAEIIGTEIANLKASPEYYLDEVLKALAALKPLKMIIAFEPNEETIDKLIEYVRDQINPFYVLEIEYDPKIIGGAIIISKGVYRDYSLKKTIWQTLKIT